MPQRKQSTRGRTRSSGRRWVRNVKTVSTFPPEGLFSKDARTIARVMASEEVSPKGIGSGIRMIQYFINRAGRSLPAARKRELEKAKRMLQRRMKRTAPASGAARTRRRRRRSP